MKLVRAIRPRRKAGLSLDKGGYQLSASPPKSSNPYFRRIGADVASTVLCFFCIIDSPIKLWSSCRSSRISGSRRIVISWLIEVLRGWRAIKAVINFKEQVR